MKSRSLVLRCKKLSALCDGLESLCVSVGQGECELYEAIKRSFCKCNFLCMQNDRFFCKDTDLSGDDITAVDNFFATLGSSVKKVECERITSFNTGLKKRLKEAENDAAQKGKVYQTLGICIGLSIGILLI